MGHHLVPSGKPTELCKITMFPRANPRTEWAIQKPLRKLQPLLPEGNIQYPHTVCVYIQ